jgi:hypothetical protein
VLGVVAAGAAGKQGMCITQQKAATGEQALAEQVH